MSSFKVSMYLLAFISSNYRGDLVSIIQLVGLKPGKRGVSVVKSFKKSGMMFTYEFFHFIALSLIAITVFLSPHMVFAVYVMFYRPGRSLSS